jgi:hypothetical protein
VSPSPQQTTQFSGALQKILGYFLRPQTT